MTGKKKQMNSTLGRGLMNDKSRNRAGHVTSDTTRHTTDLNDGTDWATLNVRSVTEESTLDEFLSTALLSGTQFTAERQNIKIVDVAGVEDISEERRQAIVQIQNDNRELLGIPRRPKWNPNMSKETLTRMEEDSFMTWRRNLAKLQEKEDVIMTPFERNLEFWRQLWRVIERSDVVVQILDARNPFIFLCQDLQKYVVEVDDRKINVILLNKADHLTDEQRRIWAGYCNEMKVKAVFYSAVQQTDEAEDADEVGQQDDGENEVGQEDDGEGEQDECEDEWEDCDSNSGEETNSHKVLSRDELVQYFKALRVTGVETVKPEYLTVGMVGYPNVGKSSTINSILQLKKVSVSQTPGKTKHFQTMMIDDDLCLCDCPGLVFPNFVSSKAEMIVNGILSVNQMTDHLSPVNLITRLIPGHMFARIYSINLLKRRDADKSGEYITADEVLNSYGYMRGFMTHRGLPDTARAARYIIKDYISGKLLYCHSPPGVDQAEFHPFPKPTGSDGPTNMTQRQLLVMRGANVTAVSDDDFDKTFFSQKVSGIHSKGVHGVDGFSRLSGDYVHHVGGENSAAAPAKPWKLYNKHKNKNKKEKLKRIYGHLDQ